MSNIVSQFVAPASTLPSRVRLHAAAELVAVVAILEVGMWELCGPLDAIFRLAALPLVALVVWHSHRRRAQKLYASESPTHAWLKTLIATLLLALLTLVLSLALRGEGESLRYFWLEKGQLGLASYLAGKGAFVAVQQLLLHYFLAPCCVEIFQQCRVARIAAATIFGLVHLPSLLLVAITVVAGYVWVRLFDGGRRILPLVVSHLALAVLAHAALPERWTLNMRVGAPAQELALRYRVPLSPQFAPHFRQLCSDHYFEACGGTDDAFLTGLYRDVLLRAESPSEAELAAWRDKLAAHARADIVVEFFNSQEYAASTQLYGESALAARLEQRLAVTLASPLDGIRR